ncbi:MAG: AAA family ATPase [Oligoflexia bacterium]|nr:AAA family ATPase [Oligoflexia bacterium]
MELILGYDDFGKIIDQKLDFVDKSLFIKEFLDSVGTEVTVITRPRRFGKTLNLSMLRYFLASEIHGRSTKGMFDNLKIAHCGNDKNGVNYISHQGQYPVIFLTFKDVKEVSYTDAINKLRIIIRNLYQESRFLIKSERLEVDEKSIIQKMMDAKSELADLEVSLLQLSNYLSKHYQKNVFILLDEYDTPLQASFLNGYYDEMKGFMQKMLGTALKGNPYLNRALVTGVIRVAKESFFSGLNNPKIYSVMQSQYSEYFGFTQEEVDDLLKKFGMSDQATDVRKWYNGYRFAGTIVYNPWSIVNFIASRELRPYWVNTSDNALIQELVMNSRSEFKEALEKLLRGETCEQLINEHVVFGDLKQNPGAAWSLLVSAGYLNVVSSIIQDDVTTCVLEIPNREVYGVYRYMIKGWLSSTQGISWYNEFLKNLLSGNMQEFYENLEILFTQVISVRDIGREPEAFYHALMLGLICSLDRNIYEIISNAESGYGHSDIMIVPKIENKLGIVLELKSLKEIPKKEQTVTRLLEKSAKEALTQIEKLNYVAGMQKRGIKEILKVGIAFAGKRFQIATAVWPPKKISSAEIKKIGEKKETTKKKVRQAKSSKKATKAKKISKSRKIAPPAKNPSKRGKITKSTPKGKNNQQI